MTVPGNANPLLMYQAAGAAGYEIERSLRFNSADSAYLSRTPGSAGNRKTWTWAGWVKRSNLSDIHGIFCVDSNNRFLINSSGSLFFDYQTAGIRLVSSSVYRDPSAWYHIVLSVDTSQSTASDRIKFYVNGSVLTSFATANYPTQNLESSFNNNVAHQLGNEPTNNYYFSGYLADIHFIDGQALDPASFGEFDTNGVWQPIAYAGSYGTNGFHLDFADNSSAAALGYDAAGSNDWTVNNLSVAAGSGNDSLRDSPTNGSQTDTGVGGEVVGNYCTWNPLSRRASSGRTLANGNLDTAGDNNNFESVLGSIAMPSGKWYWECTVGTINIFNQTFVGIASSLPSGSAIDYGYYSDNGQKKQGTTSSSYGASFTVGDVVGVAFDADGGSITFYKNGVSQGVAFTSIPSANYFPCINGAGLTTYSLNAGARPFAYTAPSGFKALCTANLPTPTIADGSTVMDVLTWTGDGNSTRSLTGLGFNPDLVWLKSRSVSNDHNLFDSVRGVEKTLSSNLTAAEVNQPIHGYVTAFNSDGFSVAGGSLGDVNFASRTYVGWTWDAGTSNATNTNGTITSTVRANISAGFSIVTYTGNGSAGATIGHGLGAAPALIIAKIRTAGFSWNIYHQALGNTKALYFDTSTGATSVLLWNNTSPTSSVFTVGSSSDLNSVGQDFVAYCWTPVAGYSAFGSYVGNGSSDGPFQWCGFRPAYVLIKGSTSVTSWNIVDKQRLGYNSDNYRLFAESSSAENATGILDFTSNGFKIRNTGGDYNDNAQTYVWAAFAEHPFALARAR